MWQDWVLMLTGFIYAPSLIPMMVSSIKVPRGTSLPTTIGLSISTFCFFTLKLDLAAISSGATALCWFIIFLRSFKEELVDWKWKRSN